MSIKVEYIEGGGQRTAAEIGALWRQVNTLSSGRTIISAIEGGKIIDGTLNASALVTGSITAEYIAAGAINAGHIQALSISSGHISALAINAGHISSNAIEARHITAGVITATHIAAGSITAQQIASNTITAAQIAANTITALQIAANTITAAQIAANTITGDRITAGTITGDLIAGTTITGDKIATGAITSTKISVSDLSAISANLGTITAGTITGGTFQTSSSTTAPRIVISPSLGITAYGTGGSAAGNILFNVSPTTGYVTSLAGFGGINWLKNSGFEDTALSSWSSYANGGTQTLASETALANIQQGTGAARITVTSAGVTRSGLTQTIGTVSQPFVKGGERAVVSAYVKGAVGRTVTLWVDWVDSANVVQGATSWTSTITTAGNFQRFVSSTFTVPATAVFARVYAWVNNPANGEVFYWDSAQLELGEFATAYGPRPGEVLPNQITSAELASGSVSGGNVASAEIVAGTIIGTDLLADTITAREIAASTITATEIAANTITAGKIATGTITAVQIAGGTITGDKIAAGTITTTLLNATAIDGMTITGATLQTSAAVVQRVVINPDGLTAYGPDGITPQLSLPTSGSPYFKGRVNASGGIDVLAAGSTLISTNYLKNPSAEVNATDGGWTAVSGTLSRTTDFPPLPAGGAGFRITSSGSGAGNVTELQNSNDRASALPGQIWAGAASIRASVINRNATVLLRFFDSTGNTISTPSGTLTAVPSGQYARVYISGVVAPANTASVQIIVRMEAPVSGEVTRYDALWLGQVSLVGEAPPNYFDGTYTDAEWSGTAHNSVSYLYAPVATANKIGWLDTTGAETSSIYGGRSGTLRITSAVPLAYHSLILHTTHQGNGTTGVAHYYRAGEFDPWTDQKGTKNLVRFSSMTGTGIPGTQLVAGLISGSDSATRFYRGITTFDNKVNYFKGGITTTPTGAFTHSFWLRVATFPEGTLNLSRATATADPTSGYIWNAQLTGGSPPGEVDPTGNINITVSTSAENVTHPVPLSTNTTYHIALVYDGTNFTTYVNGAVQASTAITGTLGSIAEQQYGWIQSYSAADFTFDEPALWNIALTQAQIQDQHNTGMTGVSTKTEAYARKVIDATGDSDFLQKPPAEQRTTYFPSAPVQSSASMALGANNQWYTEVTIPYRTTLTGIQYQTGAGLNNTSVIVALYDYSGARVAVSNAVSSASTSYTFQKVPFTTPFNVILAGKYLLSIMMSTGVADAMGGQCLAPSKYTANGSFASLSSTSYPTTGYLTVPLSTY